MPGVDTGTALLILVVFVLPGFIAVLVKERIYEVRPEETSFDRLLVSVPHLGVGPFVVAGGDPRPVAAASRARNADVLGLRVRR